MEAFLASSIVSLGLFLFGLSRYGIERWAIAAPALGAALVAIPSTLCQLYPNSCPKSLAADWGALNFIRPITEQPDITVQPVNSAFGQTIDLAKPLVVTAPTVSSISRLDADPTNQASVRYQVQFDQEVMGVGLSSFQLAISQGSLTGAGLVSIQGSGTTYRVTANTGNGNGTIQLNLIDNDQIKNSSGTPLGGTGANNGNFAGPTYTVNRPVTPPSPSPQPSPSPSPLPSPQPPQPQPVPGLW